MARSSGAAGLVLAGIPLGDSPAIEATLGSLAAAGIRAFLLPGALLGEPDRLAAIAKAARDASKAAGLGPALIAIGGSSVPAFGQPFFPAALTALGLAALNSRPAARRAGRILGEALAGHGVDLILAPRLDLAVDPKDSAGVLDRFGEDPEVAGTCSAAFVRGLRSAGVEACIGRFPGLGSACPERAEGMAFVSLPAERLAAVEMRPFARAIRAGVAAVLVGRALVPSLEPERIPAARSSRVIEGRLREALGFKGLVIGDDAGTEHDLGEAILLGALAGCDLSLAARPADALAAAGALEDAMASGKLPTARVVVARSRLDRFLGARRPQRRASAGIEPERIEKDRADSMTLLKGDLVMPPGRVFVLVFLPPSGSPDAAEIPAVTRALTEGFPGTELAFIPADPSPSDAQGLAERLSTQAGGRIFASAVALTYDAHFRPTEEGLARLVEESVDAFYVVAMRDPYDAAFFPRARGLAAAYGFTASGAAAVARLLAGTGSPAGKCPVEVIGLEV